MNVYHEPNGLLFRKLEGEVGISYVAIDPDEVDGNLTGLLVRHGSPESGCGYYPASLVMADSELREKVAAVKGRRKPSERWIGQIRNRLIESGILY